LTPRGTTWHQEDSGRYVLLHHNSSWNLEIPGSIHKPRNPACIALGEYRPNADQPIWFSDSNVFLDSGNTAPDRIVYGMGNMAVYTSFTTCNGKNIFWYPDSKYWLPGKEISDKFLNDFNVPKEVDKMKKQFVFLILVILFSIPVYAQSEDWRNAENGNSILTNGYCDQPYVVVLPSGKWLCVFTTNEGEEGSGGQHIVSSISEDSGETWSKPVKIEKPGKESKSWAMPYLTDYGRVYVFYSYNGDKIHELNGRKIREDIIGWYCYKYTDDEGQTWSKRYRLDVRETFVDRNNDWGGDVQIFWGIGKPVDVDKGMMFAFTKVGKFMLDDSEGWFFRCDNIHTEKNVNKLEWKMLPEGDHGIKNETFGLINSEHNIFQMGNGTIYCMSRTISGYPTESYSYDGGKNWTLPQPPEYQNGNRLKTPRACPRIWKTSNGRYLFWYHNNGGWNFDIRNPAWISGGIEKDGKIIWGQPEILLYEDEKSIRMSYPDLIEQNGKYWITETNKSDARCHEVPVDFMNMLWKQFEINELATKGLVEEWDFKSLKTGNEIGVPDKNVDYSRGFTLDLQLELGDLTKGQPILKTLNNNGTSVILQTGEYGSIEIILSDGESLSKWNSDPGLLTTYNTHNVSVSVDNAPGIVQFVVDGVVSTGRNFRMKGWRWFDEDIEKLIFNKLEVGKMNDGHFRPPGKIVSLRLYNRPLMNTEMIGNHNFFISNTAL
jgi:hypothetical protein